jgi:hypothetical protein
VGELRRAIASLGDCYRLRCRAPDDTADVVAGRPNRFRPSRVGSGRVRATRGRVRPNRVRQSRVRQSRVRQSRVRQSRGRASRLRRGRASLVRPSRLAAHTATQPELRVPAVRHWPHLPVRLPKSQARRRLHQCRRVSSASWRFLSCPFAPRRPRRVGDLQRESDMALVENLRCSSQLLLPLQTTVHRGLC